MRIIPAPRMLSSTRSTRDSRSRRGVCGAHATDASARSAARVAQQRACLQKGEQCQLTAVVASAGHALEHRLERQRRHNIHREPAPQVSPRQHTRVIDELACSTGGATARISAAARCRHRSSWPRASARAAPVLSTRPVTKFSATSSAKTASITWSSLARCAEGCGANAVSYGTETAVKSTKNSSVTFHVRRKGLRGSRTKLRASRTRVSTAHAVQRVGASAHGCAPAPLLLQVVLEPLAAQPLLDVRHFGGAEVEQQRAHGGAAAVIAQQRTDAGSARPRPLQPLRVSVGCLGCRCARRHGDGNGLRARRVQHYAAHHTPAPLLLRLRRRRPRLICCGGSCGQQALRPRHVCGGHAVVVVVGRHALHTIAQPQLRHLDACRVSRRAHGPACSPLSRRRWRRARRQRRRQRRRRRRRRLLCRRRSRGDCLLRSRAAAAPQRGRLQVLCWLLRTVGGARAPRRGRAAARRKQERKGRRKSGTGALAKTGARLDAPPAV
jgi:hypothetical protein